jgi:hypothetical protein
LGTHQASSLLSTQDAKDRLREIVEGFFFGRLRTEDAKRAGRAARQSPPELRKARQAIERAIR